MRIALLLCLLLPFGCSSEVESVEEFDDLGYRIQYKRNKETYAKEGTYQRFSPAGQLVELATYRQDSLEGKRILFSDQGDTLIVENYAGGVFRGPYRRFYEDASQVLQQGQYVDNRMEGLWRAFYKNGQLKEEVQFANNQEEGPFKEWYENGEVKAEGTYRDGDNEDGELRLYDPSGVLERIMQCEMGICRTSWVRDSTQVVGQN